MNERKEKIKELIEELIDEIMYPDIDTCMCYKCQAPYCWRVKSDNTYRPFARGVPEDSNTYSTNSTNDAYRGGRNE